jgi:hypothetical protein
MALGLGITRLLTGIAQFVQHPQRQRVYWVHLGWVLFMLVSSWILRLFRTLT